LRERNIKILENHLEGVEENAKLTTNDATMEKYNPDQKHLMYNIAKKKRKDGIDEGIFQKIKHETTEMLAKHLAAED